MSDIKIMQFCVAKQNAHAHFVATCNSYHTSSRKILRIKKGEGGPGGGVGGLNGLVIKMMLKSNVIEIVFKSLGLFRINQVISTANSAQFHSKRVRLAVLISR